jgi:hypothetical protein
MASLPAEPYQKCQPLLNRKRRQLKRFRKYFAFIEGSETRRGGCSFCTHDHVGVKNGDVYNGADDDGSGTVAPTRIAEAFAKAKKDGHGSCLILFFPRHR